MWREYGLKFCNNEIAWKRIDSQLVQHIDAHDNGQKTYQTDATGVEPYLIEDVVRLYNPSPLDKVEAGTHNKCFMEAVTFARALLNRLRKIELETAQAEEQFLQIYRRTSDKRFVVLDRKLPFKQLLEQLPELLYVVYPYETGESWLVEAAAVAPQSFESRRPFPEAWRGIDAEELRRLTGVADATFCHATGFIAGAVSRAGAEALMRKGLEA